MALAILLAAVGSAPAAERRPAFPQTVAVAQTFNNSPFAYRIESRSEKAGIVVYQLTYSSPVVTPTPQNNTIPAEYYLPKRLNPTDAKRPAVIVLHILNGNFELERMTCSMLASHGIPAILFKLPYYGERNLPGGHKAVAADPKLFVEAMSQALQDVRRTVDLLASRPEVDAGRIGVTGISMGGILAATAAGIEPRLSRVMLVLSGGDLEQIIDHAEETREMSTLIKGLPPEERTAVEQALEAIDPLRHAPALRGRAQQKKVLMVNAGDDRVIPRACTDKLAAALGINDRVVWLDGLGHYTAMAAFPQVLRTTVDFFAEDLPAELKTKPGAGPAQPSQGRSPTGVVTSLLREINTFAASEPHKGRCHLADLEVSVTPKKGKAIEGRLQLIRGWHNRFRIEVKAPGLLEAALGQGQYPWIASGAKAVFKGTGGPGAEPGDPLSFADHKHLVKMQVVAGAVAGILLVPDMLEQVVNVKDDTTPGGPKALRITAKGKDRGHLRLVMKEDGKTLETITVDASDVHGTLTLRTWQLNTIAPEALFDPPSGVPRKEVGSTELYRIFSAMFNFAMESAE